MEDKLFQGFIKLCVGVVYLSGAAWVATKCYASGKKAIAEANSDIGRIKAGTY